MSNLANELTFQNDIIEQSSSSALLSEIAKSSFRNRAKKTTVTLSLITFFLYAQHLAQHLAPQGIVGE